MITYDDVDGFINYTSMDEWRNYIENSLLPLWNASRMIKEYFEYLKDKFDNVRFDEVAEEDKPLLLGGIKPSSDEVYSRNSLAKFYLRFFGLKIKDLQSWIIQQRLRESLTEVTIEVAEPEFITFVKEVFNILNGALESQPLVTNFEEPSLSYDELRAEPKKVKELVKKFYQSLLNTTINYNYGTFFLFSINQITYKYMKTAYPRIDEILDFLQIDFGLTELDWNNPINQQINPERFREYTIFCFPEYNPKKTGKSFGGAICKLNELIWNKFSYPSELKETLSILFGDIPNLKEEFKQRIEPQLPEKIHTRIYFEGIVASENRSSMKESVLDMLDDNMPFLFTNLIKITHVYDNELIFSDVG